MQRIAFKIKKAGEKKVLQGHPWVFETSIIKQSKEGKAGDLAVIFSQRNDKFLAIGLYDPNSPIRIKILHCGSPVQIDRDFFNNKFKQALEIRSPLLETETNAFRLIYGENDGFPGLIVDIYEDVAVIKLYSEVWFPFLEMVIEGLHSLLPIQGVVLRLNRRLQKDQIKYKDGEVVWGSLKSEEIIFLEHGLKFKANVLKGHKTGYFLDHRHNRLKVRGLSKDKRVLDIFSYAGGFSVNAIAGGANEVISLDISKQALEMAKENVFLNFKNSNHKTMAVDAFKGLANLKEKGDKFDLIICDPPSFAKSEKEIPGAILSYKRLIKSVIPLINKGGILLMASCSSRIDNESFFEMVEDELNVINRRFEILDATTHDIDHPIGIKELSYLKSMYIQL